MARQHMVGDQKTGPSRREGSAGTGLKLQRAIGKHMDGRVRQTSIAEGGRDKNRDGVEEKGLCRSRYGT